MQTNFQRIPATGQVDLYVGYTKTGIYYRLLPSGEPESPEQMNLAMLMKKAIDEQDITPKNRSWAMFNLQTKFSYYIKKVEILDYWPPATNQLHFVSGFEIKPSEQAEIIKRFSDFSLPATCEQRLVNGVLSNRVGINFYSHAYGLYFI